MWLIWDNMDEQRFGIISESEFEPPLQAFTETRNNLN